MSPGVRLAVFALAAAALVLLWFGATARLPEPGQGQSAYAELVTIVIPAERRTGQTVGAITFDVRGFDTLGEEFILFAAVCGVSLLLRIQATEGERQPRDQAAGRSVPPPPEQLRLVGPFLFPFTLLFGLYIVAHGHLTPGGGFQGGVILASAFLFVYLSATWNIFQRLARERLLDMLEGGAALMLVAAGLVGLWAGRTFLENVLPLGTRGALVSAGLIPLLNLATGLEVAAGFLLVLSAFLHQALMVRKRR